jgi:hypothetical protein
METVTLTAPTSTSAGLVRDESCQNLHPRPYGQAPGSSPCLQGRMWAGAIKSHDGRSGVSKSADVAVLSRFWVAAGTLCASVAGGFSRSLSAPLGSFVALQTQGWICKGRHAAPHVHAPWHSQCKWPIAPLQLCVESVNVCVRVCVSVCVCVCVWGGGGGWFGKEGFKRRSK